MKTDPKESMGAHQKQDAGESTGHGSTGKEMEGQELNKYGKPEKGGGYTMKAGKLCKMAKSLDTDDLEKSIELLEGTLEEDGPTRKQTLLEKAQTDELSKAEKDELFQILGGEEVEPAEPTAADTIVKSFAENDELRKAIDVSDYLRENHEAIEASLRAVGDEIQKSDHRRHEFSMVQAKALVDIGYLVKSMAEQMEGLLGQPARAPKSRGVRKQPEHVEKSFGGNPPEGDELTRDQVLDTMEMMSKSMDHVGGERVDMALTKFESTHMISPKVLAEVKKFRQEQQASAH